MRRMGFFVSYCRLVDLGVNEGRGRGNFSRYSPGKKCKYLFFALRHTRLSAYIWSKFCCLLMVREAGPCFPLAGEICKFYACIFDHLLMLRCLLLVRQQHANELLSLVIVLHMRFSFANIGGLTKAIGVLFA
jgi:hypothetical protein